MTDTGEIILKLKEQHRNTRHDAAEVMQEVIARYKDQHSLPEPLLNEMVGAVMNLRQRQPHVAQEQSTTISAEPDTREETEETEAAPSSPEKPLFYMHEIAKIMGVKKYELHQMMFEKGLIIVRHNKATPTPKFLEKKLGEMVPWQCASKTAPSQATLKYNTDGFRFIQQAYGNWVKEEKSNS